MADISYKTIEKEAHVEYIVNKSRFIGHIKPVKSQDEALEFISEISKQYWDATHNVYAYIIREGNVKRFSDDGEPSGTAGIPALDVLEKKELTDCVVVVTRYFGGIMLGAGGLVRAYSHSTAISVDEAVPITMGLCNRMEMVCDYTFYGKVSSLIPDSGGIIEDTIFEDSVKIIFRIPFDITNQFNKKLLDASNGKYTAHTIEELYDRITVP